MWFFTLVVVLLIGAVAVVASGRWGGMNEAYDDRPDMRVPTNRLLEAGDIESSRFGVGVRGYRMDEVDSLLERLAREVAERDRRIADLERAMRPFVQGADGTGFNPVVPEGTQDRHCRRACRRAPPTRVRWAGTPPGCPSTAGRTRVRIRPAGVRTTRRRTTISTPRTRRRSSGAPEWRPVTPRRRSSCR